MAAIIEKQRVAKRRKISPLRHSNKSAGFNSEFMSQFSQKPVQLKKKKTVPRYKDTSQKVRKRESGNGGFSFPIPSLSTLAVIAGIVVIAAAALNFDFGSLISPLPPVSSTETAGERIIQYAATGIPSFGNKTEDLIPENIINIENENPHGGFIPFEWQQYKVQRGDTVSGIAQKFSVSVGAVIASNNISNARRLQEGASLRIPNIDGIPYQVKRGDNLSRIAASFNVPLEIILDINDIKSDTIRIGETLFIPGGRMNDIDLRLSLGELFTFPLQGRRHITSHYGMRRDPFTGVLQFHDGVDFRADTGTPVLAALDGVVSFVGESWLYGKYIIISHSNGYKTLYGHLSVISMKQGDRVARGRKIGESGNTGYSTGPHLHFGILDKNNSLVNPLDLLN